MNKKYSLKFPQQPITLREVRKLGLTRYDLRKLLNSGEVSKIGRNLYVGDNSSLDDEALFISACSRVGEESAICLLSALSHYGLIDEIPNKTWVLVPESKRARWTDLRLVRSRRPQWSIGIEKLNGYRITSVSRTLVDALIFKRLVGSKVVIDALRRALHNKKVRLNDILKVAKQLKVEKRIAPYIEAFL